MLLTTARRLSWQAVSHHYTYRAIPRLSSTWSTTAAPPRLPKEEQEIFEQLQRQSTGAFSSPRSDAPESSPPSSSEVLSTTTHSSQSSPSSTDASSSDAPLQARVRASGSGEELHPDIRRGARPEFEGERNPKTGEVGGPKNEPLRWGHSGDWSYNGRVTDF